MPICYHCYEPTNRGVQYHHISKWEQVWIRAMCCRCLDFCNDQKARWCEIRSDGTQIIPLIWCAKTKTWEKDQETVDQYKIKSTCSIKCFPPQPVKFSDTDDDMNTEAFFVDDS
jgi:hypothetical protein